jgi:hypothetical protein
VKTKDELARCEATLVPFDRSIGLDSPFQKTPVITLKKEKKTVQSGDAFEDTPLKPDFEIVKIPNQVVLVSAIHISVKYIAKWLSDVELNQVSAFFTLLFQD